ncbi:hypothetical protein KY290_036423 [Solanum tuberosum]|uniref:DUF4283 domain-containing protein n=1 Tax=Solanum tuberosum TaxID=4113 RepID=A0ABQ7TUL1_SOLTU|nr:hypothetical protein KY289_035943 [Solanum tuberosum]KAH0639143.1 hypothetical protein KY285_035729 [Solanum tuberosum]KAH0737718.1 hypothetical protein KY290_036423 [Solanum tuberosum]
MPRECDKPVQGEGFKIEENYSLSGSRDGEGRGGEEVSERKWASLSKGNRLAAQGMTLQYVAPIAALERYIAAYWNYIVKPKVYYHNDGYFLVKFTTLEDRDEVFYAGPHMLNKKPIIVKIWTPDFDFTKEVDKISYARLLIEVDITRTLPTEIKVEDPNGRSFKQVVKYEWVPSYCPTCLTIGHICKRDDAEIKAKPTQNKQKMEWKQRVNVNELQRNQRPGKEIVAKEQNQMNQWSAVRGKSAAKSGIQQEDNQLIISNDFSVFHNHDTRFMAGGGRDKGGSSGETESTTILRHNGREFTWTNGNTYNRIDWALVNAKWMLDMQFTDVKVLDPGCSDHSPLCITLMQEEDIRHKPFKFLNHLAKHENFQEIVQRAWKQRPSNGTMYRIWQKLQNVKKGLKELNSVAFYGGTE